MRWGVGYYWARPRVGCGRRIIVRQRSAKLKRYFRRAWAETRGDQYSHWGASVWYFEVDSSGLVLRQLEIYEAGPRIAFHDDHREDDFGGLSLEPLDLTAFSSFEIDRESFEAAWRAGPFENTSAA